MRSVGRSKIGSSIPTSSLFSVAFILTATVFMTASATSVVVIEDSEFSTTDAMDDVQTATGTIIKPKSDYENLYVADYADSQAIVDSRDGRTWKIIQGTPPDAYDGTGTTPTTSKDGTAVFEDVNLQAGQNYTVYTDEDGQGTSPTFANGQNLAPFDTNRFSVESGIWVEASTVIDRGSSIYSTAEIMPYNDSDTNITYVKETVDSTYYLYDTFSQDSVDATEVVNVEEGMLYENGSLVQNSDYAEAFITLHDVAVVSTLDINVSYDTNSSGIETRAIGYDENGTNVTYNETVDTNFSTSKSSLNTTPINDALGNDNITDVRVVFRTTVNSSQADFAIQDIALSGNMEKPVFTVGGFIDSATSVGEIVGQAISNVISTIIDMIVGIFTGGVA